MRGIVDFVDDVPCLGIARVLCVALMRVGNFMQVTVPLCDSDMSTTVAGHCLASPCSEMKEMLAVSGTVGGIAEAVPCAVDRICKPGMTDGLVSEATPGIRRHEAVEIVEETPCSEMVVEAAAIAVDKPSDSGKDSCKQVVGESDTKMECSEALEDAEGGSGVVLEGPYQASKNSTSSTPEIHKECKMSESGEYGESAEVVGDGAEAMGVDSVSMEVEEKSAAVSGKKQAAAAAASFATFQVAAARLGGGRSTRPMVKRVMSGMMDGKFYKREHVHRSSQRLHPEIMTKKLESYSKSLKVRRAVKVAKRNHVAVTRTKRQHAEIESTDSGSSEGSNSLLWWFLFFRLWMLRRLLNTQCGPEEEG